MLRHRQHCVRKTHDTFFPRTSQCRSASYGSVFYCDQFRAIALRQKVHQALSKRFFLDAWMRSYCRKNEIHRALKPLSRQCAVVPSAEHFFPLLRKSNPSECRAYYPKGAVPTRQMCEIGSNALISDVVDAVNIRRNSAALPAGKW